MDEAPRIEIGFHASVLSGVPDLVGLSASGRLGPGMVEVGASTMFFASSAFARGGVMVPLTSDELRAPGHGGLRFIGLAGWRWLVTVPFDSVERVHGPNAVVGLDGLFWMSERLALSARLVGGVAVWTKSDNVRPVFPDIRLSLGVVL